MKTVEEVVTKVLGLKPEQVNDQSGPDNLENWDSFNGLILVTELEKNFNVSFSLEEIVEVKKVSDIKKILKHHGVKV